ncbi:hypothetical protein H4R34_004916, partial [Dimargaris verticillata]
RRKAAAGSDVVPGITASMMSGGKRVEAVELAHRIHQAPLPVRAALALANVPNYAEYILFYAATHDISGVPTFLSRIQTAEKVGVEVVHACFSRAYLRSKPRRRGLKEHVQCRLLLANYSPHNNCMHAPADVTAEVASGPSIRREW